MYFIGIFNPASKTFEDMNINISRLHQPRLPLGGHSLSQAMLKQLNGPRSTLTSGGVFLAYIIPGYLLAGIHYPKPEELDVFYLYIGKR